MTSQQVPPFVAALLRAGAGAPRDDNGVNPTDQTNPLVPSSEMRGEAVPGVLRKSWSPGACIDPLWVDRLISQKERLYTRPPRGYAAGGFHEPAKHRRYMKIVARTPTELIIRDSALMLRGFGIFLAALGAFAIWVGMTQDSDGRVGTVPVVLGSLIALGGLALFALPSRKTFAFSKTERVFVIAKERFGRVERQTIPLRDIADVSVEESTSSDSGSTYRVSVTLVDQRRVAWTSYYTSGYISKRAVVEVVREFLGFDASPVLGTGATTISDERAARRGRVGLFIMGAVCCLFLGIGLTMLIKEQRRLLMYEPVAATVLSARVEEHSDSDGSTYEPVVVYRYRVADREYTASRVTPLRESRGGDWARRVTSRYAIGGDYTAFYDPEDPAEAFLLRSRSFLPWAFVGIPFVGIMLLVAGIRASGESARMSHWPRSRSGLS
jgi:hypothetical protein